MARFGSDRAALVKSFVLRSQMSETVQTPKFEYVIFNEPGIKLSVREFFSFDSFAFRTEGYKSCNL
jgi:hypothetical protein